MLLFAQILETLFNIQSSLFADAFGLTSYVFYAASLIGIHILTIPERTNDSKQVKKSDISFSRIIVSYHRFWLILLWLCLIGIERYMLFFSSYSQVIKMLILYHFVMKSFQIILYEALWRFRQLWFFVSWLTLTYHAIRYRNYYKENQKLIDDIDRKHKQLEIAARKCNIL